MRYNYYCPNADCIDKDKVVTITKKMAESDREEFCETCGGKLERTIESLVCGMSVDKTGSFYRSVN